MESLLLLEKAPFRRIVICPVARPSDGHGYVVSLATVGNSGNETASPCKIDLLPADTLDISQYSNLYERPIFGCLGMLNFGSDDFICIITDITHVGTINGRKLYRIDQVDFVCLSSKKYDNFGASVPNVGVVVTTDDFEYNRKAFRQATGEHPCAGIASFLSESTFYFGYDWDSTKNLQKSSKLLEPFSWANCERSFFWNRYLLNPVVKFAKSLFPARFDYIHTCGIFVACFEGYADVAEFSFGSQCAAFALFSRVSCKRAGTRFRSRGIDDDGNVSNFVETETLFAHPEFTLSHIIIRGTVPVFWDQQGFQLGYPKIQLTRTPAATQPSFDRHISNLKESYGLVHVVNLLSQREGQAEHVLSNALDFHIRKYPKVGILSQTTFDVYSVCKNSNFERLESLFHLIGRDLQIFGYLVTDKTGTVVREQKGIFRVNCLDCLDRTNIIQNYIVKRTVDLFVRNYLLGSGITYDAFSFQASLSNLWNSNGDQLSRIYTGSNAIKSSYGRLSKFTFTSFVEDFKNTAKRFYSNNFTEKNRQQVIDCFLGKMSNQRPVILYSPAPDLIDSQMFKSETIFVQVLTWNTNGAVPIADEDYLPLISTIKGMPVPHILAVGFQEIVQLNATQIMSVDPERRILWEGFILKMLNERYSKQSFSLLVSHQLVGTTMSIFIRSDHIESVRQVEIASKKTGMGGMTGNKGSVAIRMDVYNSSVCFVSSHFSAGQSNPAERDRDMLYALNELQMSGGRDILAHDVIFWFGDMNYRIDLDREIVREGILEKNYQKLRVHDQLQNRINEGLIFQNFGEAEINFAPTYKYDPGTNIYDSSEKMRIPSWTDRILFRGEKIQSLFYDRAEIDISDHKPVKGLFQVEVLKIDRVREAKVRANISASMHNLKTTDENEFENSDYEQALNSVGPSFDLIDLCESLEQPPPLYPRPNTTKI